jgi:hypothetical protein
MHAHRHAVLALGFALLAASAVAQVTVTTSLPPVVGFTDISGTGLPIPGVSDDSEHNVSVTLFPNPLLTSSDYRIGNNGVVVNALTTGDLAFTNSPIPASGVPFGLAVGGSTYFMPYWDDLFPVTSGMTLYVQLLGGVLIFQWHHESHFDLDTGQQITFQVQIFDTSMFPNCTPAAQFLYQDTFFGAGSTGYNFGSSATIGIANSGANASLSFNAPTVGAGSVVSFSKMLATLGMAAPFGPGSFQVSYTPFGNCIPDFRVLALTLNHGAFPNGWLFGLDIPFNELLSEYTIGPPFTGDGSAFVLGPVFGIPSGLEIHGLVLGFSGGTLVGATPPLAFTTL